MAEILLGLLGIAVVLGLIALYHYYADPETIEEEEREKVEQETPEERQAALQREHEWHERTRRVTDEDLLGNDDQ